MRDYWLKTKYHLFHLVINFNYQFLISFFWVILGYSFSRKLIDFFFNIENLLSLINEVLICFLVVMAYFIQIRNMHWFPTVERTDFSHCVAYYDEWEIEAQIQIDTYRFCLCEWNSKCCFITQHGSINSPSLCKFLSVKKHHY